MKNKGRFVNIYVNQECWRVPRGFGRLYKDNAKDLCEPEVLRDILGLIGYTANPKEIELWPTLRRVEALVYCSCVHTRAGDNPCPVPPKPRWFPEPWEGGEPDGIWGPPPTPLPKPPSP